MSPRQRKPIKRVPRKGIRKVLHAGWVRVILLIIFIGTSATVTHILQVGHAVVVPITAITTKTIDVLLDVIADRVFPDVNL
jgi:hypothetical protein